MTQIADYNKSELEMLFNGKLTENGDASFVSTGNNLLDILFKSEYFTQHPDEAKIGDSEIEKLFAMFIRDPRFGIGRRDLGRKLMRDANLDADKVVLAGRYDDLWAGGYDFIPAWLSFLFTKCNEGDELAKKWMPRYSSKNLQVARQFAKMLGLNKQLYGKFVKVNTVENKLSRKDNESIDFSKLPSLALLKYWARFAGNDGVRTDMQERFNKYLESVKKGEAKMNMSVATVYDIYRKRNDIDPDIAFDQIKKISGSWIPIVDTSGSMTSNDALGKALAVGHYLAKCSTYCPDQVITFSSKPQLIKLGQKAKLVHNCYSYNSYLNCY